MGTKIPGVRRFPGPRYSDTFMSGKGDSLVPSDHSGIPVADLSGPLLSLLARSGLVIVIAALLAAVATRVWQRRRAQGERTAPGSWWGPRPAATGPLRIVRVGLGMLWILDGLLQAQPRMPAGFVGNVLTPSIDGAPHWVATISAPLLRLWSAHPVVADAATVWVQVGLGLLILLGARGGRIDSIVLWVSILWCAVVWVFGEAFGGMLARGASWIAGSPGAVIVYAMLAAILLWGRERSAAVVARGCRRAAGAWLVVGAAIQGIGWEGNFQADTLTASMQRASQTAQPTVFSSPIGHVAALSGRHPAAVNGVLVLVMLVLALGLLLTSARVVVIAAGVFGLAIWWLGQDFGVLGGYGTDPNSALPWVLLVLAGWPVLDRARALSAEPAHAVRAAGPVRSGIIAAALVATGVVPLALGVAVLRPADAQAVRADSGGGLTRLDGSHPHDFRLTDQQGRPITLSGLTGKVTLVTFLDPVCSDDCPVIANQIASAIRRLGARADSVAVVAIDTNPLFDHVADVEAFTTSHGLTDLAGWHFVTGPAARIRPVLAEYGVTVAVPAVGMVSHSEGIYFLTRSGAQVGYLADGANAQLTTPYATLITDELTRLLG